MSRPRLETPLVFAGFIVLTVLMSWPLAAHLREWIPLSFPAADPIAVLYPITWGARALLQQPFHFFQAAPFFPYPMPLTFFDLTVGISAIVAPVDRITGNMCLGYNAAWLLTFVLAGMGVYLLVRAITGRAAAAVLAGVIFAFHPFRYHNVGQINVLAMMWVPFAFLCLHLWIRTRRRRHLLLSAGFALIQALSSGYTVIFMLLAVLLYLALLLAFERDRTLDLLRRDRWWMLVAVATIVMVAAPFVLPYLAMAREQGAFRRSLGLCAAFSALPADFLSPAPGSVLRGVSPWAVGARHALFPGIAAVVLALVWVSRRGWRGHPWRTELLFYAWLIPVGAILALGPILNFGERWIPMPFVLLWYVLPGASFIRAPVRFVTMMSLGFAVVAGAGLAWLVGSRNRHLRRAWAGWAAVALAVVELRSAPVELIRPLPAVIPSAYTWLAAVPDPVVIVELPMARDEASENEVGARYQLYSLLHGKRLVNGVAAFVPPITRDLRIEMQDFPQGDSVRRLREIGVSYAMIHVDQYDPGPWEQLIAAVRVHPELEIVSTEDPVWVVRILPAAPGP